VTIQVGPNNFFWVCEIFVNFFFGCHHLISLNLAVANINIVAGPVCVRRESHKLEQTLQLLPSVLVLESVKKIETRLGVTLD